MKRSWGAALIIGISAAFFAASIASAEVMEVKGKGLLQGRIVSEKNGEIVFLNSWGETLTFPRSEVLFTQNESGVRARTKFSKSSHLLSGDLTALFDGGNVIAELHGLANDFFYEALNYLTEDAGDTLSIFKGAVKHVMETSPKKFTATNYAGGIGGIVLLGLGLISTVAFTFILIFNAFEQGFLWGIAFLADGLVFFAPFFGGAIGLAMVLPYFLSTYFVIRFWEDARMPVVGQLFSLNVVTLGYFILKGAFAW